MKKEFIYILGFVVVVVFLNKQRDKNRCSHILKKRMEQSHIDRAYKTCMNEKKLILVRRNEKIIIGVVIGVVVMTTFVLLFKKLRLTGL